MAPLIVLLLRLRVQAGGQGAFTHADQLGELPVLKPFVLDEAGQLQVRASWLSHGFHPPSFCGCVPAAPAGVCPSAVLPSACCGRSLGGLLAGKAHRQQRKAVPVHQVHGVLLVVLRVDVLGLEEQRGVPIFGEALHDFRDVADDVVMAFAEALGRRPGWMPPVRRSGWIR